MREILIDDTASPKFRDAARVRLSASSKIIRNYSLRGDFPEAFVSLELSPNRNFDAEDLPKIRPRFCSVTWHSARETDLRDAADVPAVKLSKELTDVGYDVLLHLAGRNLDEEEASRILTRARVAGVRNIFALQGDPSQIREKDDSKCRFPYALDLINYIQTHFRNEFCIGIAGYPEKHSEATDKRDVANMRKKISLGAEFIITQASYEYESIYKFARTCRSAEISLPILVGIFIFSSYSSLMAMSNFCGVTVPGNIRDTIGRIKEHPEAVREYGIHCAVELIKNILRQNGELFNGVHIFTLNNLKLSKEVLRRLGFYKLAIERPLISRWDYFENIGNTNDTTLINGIIKDAGTR